MKAVACVRALWLGYTLGRTNKRANAISPVFLLEDWMGFTTIDMARELRCPKLCCTPPLPGHSRGDLRRSRLDEEEAAQHGRRSSRAFDWSSDTVASKTTPPPPVASACLIPSQCPHSNNYMSSIAEPFQAQRPHGTPTKHACG